MKKKSHKESVVRIALTVTSVLTVGLGTSLAGVGVALYDSVEDLMYTQEQLEEAQIRIVQQQDSYKTLEQKFLSVESESQKLEKRQEELLSQLDEYKQDKKELENKVSKQSQEISNYKSQLNSLNNTSQSRSRSSQTKELSGDWKKISVVATAYSLHDDPSGSDGTPETATGTYPKEGRTIAVDPNVIPYGTEVYIPAFNGTFIAEDTGGAIKGNKIDIYMSHGSKARQWGRQTIEIYVKK